MRILYYIIEDNGCGKKIINIIIFRMEREMIRESSR